jgi:hypothetical protein
MQTVVIILTTIALIGIAISVVLLSKKKKHKKSSPKRSILVKSNNPEVIKDLATQYCKGGLTQDIYTKFMNVMMSENSCETAYSDGYWPTTLDDDNVMAYICNTPMPIEGQDGLAKTAEVYREKFPQLAKTLDCAMQGTSVSPDWNPTYCCGGKSPNPVWG